jgi:hypothetical protein
MLVLKDSYKQMKYDDAVEWGVTTSTYDEMEKMLDNEFASDKCIKVVYPKRMQTRYYVYWTKVICFTLLYVAT